MDLLICAQYFFIITGRIFFVNTFLAIPTEDLTVWLFLATTRALASTIAPPRGTEDHEQDFRKIRGRFGRAM
jgi:hypothetical protein